MTFVAVMFVKASCARSMLVELTLRPLLFLRESFVVYKPARLALFLVCIITFAAAYDIVAPVIPSRVFRDVELNLPDNAPESWRDKDTVIQYSPLPSLKMAERILEQEYIQHVFFRNARNKGSGRITIRVPDVVTRSALGRTIRKESYTAAILRAQKPPCGKILIVALPVR